MYVCHLFIYFTEDTFYRRRDTRYYNRNFIVVKYLKLSEIKFKINITTFYF